MTRKKTQTKTMLQKRNWGPKFQCKICRDEIQSKSVHDFVTCACGAISIDGGGEYTRFVGQPGNFIKVK